MELLKKRREDLQRSETAAAAGSDILDVQVVSDSSDADSFLAAPAAVPAAVTVLAVPAAVAAVAILGGVVHDPVDAVGKQEFGIEVGYTLKMSYIDPEPPMGMKQYKDKTFTCKVKSQIKK